ncbi:class I SAM-dependent methyltransferase [bacterium SCSIO 12741]|nr:class I SAM-dependent methyltransferase [bacterium SCSIO 12741]
MEFHSNKTWYFNTQLQNCVEYVIPFIEKGMEITSETRVLEIGCAEGGVLKGFLDRGCQGVGVELQHSRYELAMKFLEPEVKEGRAHLVSKNIYDTDFAEELGTFDLIVLKDVIEHIHDQDKLMKKLKDILKPDGKVFFGFPPWQMPFGGHQQVAKNKWAARLPYYHLLPYGLYRSVLKAFGESEKTIEGLIEVKDTRISLGQFEHLCKSNQYKILVKTLFLFNPIYKFKFGLKPRKQFPLVGSIPYLRNFYTTCGYYLIGNR